MTEKIFKASNGITITISDEGYLTATGGSGENSVLHATGGAEYGVQALREFFRHERDQELGRVRWPEDPDYVIYRGESEDGHGRSVRVVDEQAGRSWRVWEKGCHIGKTTPKQMAAVHWFFTEGPGKEPERPWEDAQAGEVWRLTVDGKEGTYLVKENIHCAPYVIGQTSSLYADSERITAGRKLLNADGSLADEG